MQSEAASVAEYLKELPPRRFPMKKFIAYYESSVLTMNKKSSKKTAAKKASAKK